MGNSRSRRTAWMTACLCALALVGPQRRTWGQAGTCRATSARSEEIQNYLIYVATSSDSSAVYDRAAIGIPMTTARKVNLITRASTCDNAAVAVNEALGEPGGSRDVWVYAYDRQYVVVDPNAPTPDGTPLFFFDSHWTFIIGMGFYHFP